MSGFALRLLCISQLSQITTHSHSISQRQWGNTPLQLLVQEKCEVSSPNKLKEVQDLLGKGYSSTNIRKERNSIGDLSTTVKEESSVDTNEEEGRGQLGHSNQKNWTKKHENEIPEERCLVWS